MRRRLQRLVAHARAHGLGDLMRRAPRWALDRAREVDPRAVLDRRADRDFDARRGTETREWVRVHEMGFEDTAVYRAPHTHFYEPTGVRLFRHQLRRLHARAPGFAPGQWGFLDLGSGKARTLILAAEHGFQPVVGVELSPVVHAQAVRNVAAWRVTTGARAPIELRHGDAVQTAVPDGPLVLYLYNPFDAGQLGQVVERLAARAPSELWVIYTNPAHAHVLGRLAGLRCVETHRRYAIYHRVAG